MSTKDETRDLVELARTYYLSGFGRSPDYFSRPGAIVASVDGNYCTDITGNRLRVAGGDACAAR